MDKILHKILRNRSTRVLLLLFGALLALIIYFVVHSYYIQLDIHKQKVQSRLDAIAKTVSTQINGDDLEYLLMKYPNEDDIATNQQDSVYKKINSLLAQAKKQNKLKSEIYTLSCKENKTYFEFGVSSSDNPYFRHQYSHFPKEIAELYEVGGKIGVYEDENGHWISAFVPIKNSNGDVISIIQADSLFDEFIEEANSSILMNIVISLLLTLCLAFFLLRSVRTILITEDKLTNDLVLSKQILEVKNRDIMDSISYAKRIQDAILPERSKIQQVFPNSFILFLPKDVVSGDFYWFKQIGDLSIIASVDCTGHGVPGALMSMIGSVLLEDIISKQQTVTPHLVLDNLHQKIVKVLKQDSAKSRSKDGMDIAICVINEKTKTLCYSGAFRPLVFVRNNEITQIKADPLPIGGTMYQRKNYNLHHIGLEKGDRFYIFSDGYADQFGGEKNKKYMTKRFRNFLLEISPQPMEKQRDLLKKEFEHWKGEEEQVDDVLVIGFQWR